MCEQEALSGMIFVPAQKPSGMNSNVDIKAKLTPSTGQVASDAVTVLRANACEFMSFGHSIPIYSHFKTYFTAVKRLYNIARVLALYNSYWAAMNKIFIYARPCVNKMTWAFFTWVQSCRLLSCSTLFLLFRIWKKPAKNCPIFLSALTF